MKQIKIFTIALAAMLAISSCSKDKNELQPVDNSPRKLIKRTNTIGAPRFEIYEYDTQGRVTKQEGEDALVTFVYTGNTVTIKQLRKSEGNRQVLLLTANLDGQGRITTASGVTEYQAGNILNTQRVFEYNPQGYLLKYTQVDNGSKEYKTEYAYANDNVVSKKYYENGIYLNQTVTDYDLSKPDKIGFNSTWAIGYPYILNLDGKSNKNLPIGEKLIYANNNIGWSYNTLYELDNQGYPVKMTISGGGLNEVWNYTYSK